MALSPSFHDLNTYFALKESELNNRALEAESWNMQTPLSPLSPGARALGAKDFNVPTFPYNAPLYYPLYNPPLWSLDYGAHMMQYSDFPLLTVHPKSPEPAVESERQLKTCGNSGLDTWRFPKIEVSCGGSL